MRRLITFCAAAVLILAAGSAQAVMYNFNAITPGTYNEVVFSSLFPRISFDNTGGDDFYVDTAKVVINSPNYTPGNSTVATFDLPATFFSVTMGDNATDSDNLHLFAYDAGDNEVDSDFFFNPLSSIVGHTLSVASVAGNIAWVEFYGVGAGDDNYNSVYWDNVAFTQVPIPAAVLLGMLGLSVAGLKLRRFV